MKIAQVSPLYEAVPPKLYGGTERIVSYLTEELVNQGHDVTLFASADSVTKAKLVPICDEALRLKKDCVDPLAHHIVQMQEVLDRSQEFDIIHYHTDYLHFPLSRLNPKLQLTTLHGRLDIPDLQSVYKKFKDMPVVSISNNQRKPLNFANWVATVYHGLPVDQYSFGKGEGKYLAFIGRISPEKRVDRAIEIAKKAGMKIKIAAKIADADRAYYETKIKHLFDDPLVEFVGEIGESQKSEFLGNAAALLFPIDWPEPFGLVMIESMACGTPVVAYGHGSVPEVIDPGKSGFIVHSIEEAVEAVQYIDLIDRKLCRETFEKRFSASRMAMDYVELYERLAHKTKYSVPFYRFHSANNSNAEEVPA